MIYSIDLRKRVVAAVKSGMKKVAAEKLFGVTPPTIRAWLLLDKEQGHLTPKSGYQNGHSHGIKDLDAFRAYVDAHPDYTQEELADYFGVGSSTIGRTLVKIGYSRKKRAKLMPKEAKKDA